MMNASSITGIPSNRISGDFGLKGEPVTALVRINLSEELQMNSVDFEVFIKQKLANLIAQEILNKNLCEFTKASVMDSQLMEYRARAFLIPDNQVRILREKHFIK